VSPLLKGALVEYHSDFMGSLPNVVIFQFNPEKLERKINIPPRLTGKEANQGETSPTEVISFLANINAADQLNNGNPLARIYGIAPQLAALEKMIYPIGIISEAISEAIDIIGDMIPSSEKSKKIYETPNPRPAFPSILFIWGKTRILPVVIQSLSITENHYDSQLIPINAEVNISLAVKPIENVLTDDIAFGALAYTNMNKDAQAMANMSQTVSELSKYLPTDISDIIPF
jgi:hypothetical protein